MPNPASIQLLRFSDLKAAKLVTNWPQLKRLVTQQGFPEGYLISAHTRVWDAAAVEQWLDSRRRPSPPPMMEARA
jgi:predicted DNA-binding transcriptional regulator AlpA